MGGAQGRLRRQILVAAALFPPPETPPLNARVSGRIERPGYTIEKVALETWTGYYLGGTCTGPRIRTGRSRRC
jgi:hypothetical protein